ncbi:MAG: hypothetical protein RLZZ175_216 [Bacteroidota bacterium]|jgi:beta-lactam-binding protein with PASTA domain
MADDKVAKSKLYTHIGLALGLSFVIIFGFFYVYLPWTTNHGDSVTVPDLTGMSAPELEEFLETKALKYELNDSTYDANIKPLTVISQYPKAGSKVKEGRKIYVTIRSVKPPQVKMPRLVDASLLNAQMVIQSYGLLMGKIEYVPHYAENAVLKQMVNGKEIKPGTSISKGTRVDLVIGNGSGDVALDVPNLINMPIDEAKISLSGMGIEIGSIVYDEKSSEPKGAIIKQKPMTAPGVQIKQGESIDLWVSGPRPAESTLPTE